MASDRTSEQAASVTTSGSFALLLICFALPFFTISLSTCEGPDRSSTVEVTGLEMLRGDQVPVRNLSSSPSSAYGDREVREAAANGHAPAVTAALLAALALLTGLLRSSGAARITVGLAVVEVWALIVLGLAVQAGSVDVSVRSGYWLSLVAAVVATLAAVVVAYKRRDQLPDVAGRRAAGFWIRALAWAIDAAILGCAAVVVSVAVPGTNGLMWLVVGGLVLAYRPAFEASPYQATLGARLLGLWVITPDGGRIGVGRAVLRSACEICSLVLTLGVGHLLCVFTPDRRALHDVLAGTAVTRRARAVAPPAPVPAGAQGAAAAVELP
jgi:uncharacterized RDD family membrane protein YckC